METLGLDVDSERKMLMNRDRQKLNFHNVNRLKGFKEKTMTTKIFVSRNGERVMVKNKNEIERECIAANKSKFMQANSTPPILRVFRNGYTFGGNIEKYENSGEHQAGWQFQNVCRQGR